MCGILGKVTFKGAHESPSAFDSALHQLRHRGPDDQGAHHGTGPDGCRVSMGQTRLSILDLSSAGHQPMFSPRTGSCVVFNGEIYNFREIRAVLEARGYRFTTQCDTEVVVAAYDEYGDDFTTHFVGMFAIGVWDKTRGRLVLARDRLGIKPLYYYWDQNQFAFASEVTALAALPTLRLDVNPESVEQYLLNGYIVQPHSIFHNVSKIRTGHILTLDLARPRPIESSYWDVVTYFAAPCSYRDEAEVLEAVRPALLKAVQRRLISDVPLGAFLSGGIDSSLVVALMRKAHSGEVRTFTIGFTEPKWDEADHARAIAQHLGTRHEELYLSEENILEVAQKVGDFYDEPFADTSCIPTFALSRMTRQHVTVALSGDGGDEMFWGYDSYVSGSLANYNSVAAIPRPLRVLASAFLRSLPVARWNRMGDLLRFREFSDFVLCATIWRPWSYPRLLRDRPYPTLNWGAVIGADLQRRLPNLDRDTLRSVFDIPIYMVDDILTKVDRASMAVALEARVPLLDHELVQLAAGIPIELKAPGRRLKHLLKTVLGEMVPRELWERPKKGFGVPLVDWLRTSLKDWTYDHLCRPLSGAGALLDPAQVRQMLDDHVAGCVDASNLIWACMQLVNWNDRMARIRGTVDRVTTAA